MKTLLPIHQRQGKRKVNIYVEAKDFEGTADVSSLILDGTVAVLILFFRAFR